MCLFLAAHTLVCFSCSDASSNWACLTPVKCGENENHCVTTYVGVGIGGKSGQSISKGCSPICPSAGINLGIAAASVYCCDSFLCNISGSSSVKAKEDPAPGDLCISATWRLVFRWPSQVSLADVFSIVAYKEIYFSAGFQQ
uniref:UPAR/Ly6 domain-containing protein n=1 Tax=Meleagris gallopavo TaxID=9103 RepID=G1NJZ1_MELGA